MDDDKPENGVKNGSNSNLQNENKLNTDSGETKDEMKVPKGESELDVYFKALKQWVDDAARWSAFNAHNTLLNSYGLNPLNLPIQVPGLNSTESELRRRTASVVTGAAYEGVPGVDENTPFRYTIPPLWKRLLAEFIDSVMLFVLKISITFVLLEIFDAVSFRGVANFLLNGEDETNTINWSELTYGLLLIDTIHRVITCLYEAYWLRGDRVVHGGATPGKMLVGLRVIYVTSVATLAEGEQEVVLVLPGTNLGFGLALSRAIIKNILVAIMFPVFIMQKHNRTVYDIVVSSLVVEYDPNPPRGVQ